MIKSTLFQFENLNVYQNAIVWIDEAYTVSELWPKAEIFGLTGQWRRAATSVALNIAEGGGRTSKEFCHFLDIAKTSCYELMLLRDRYCLLGS